MHMYHLQDEFTDFSAEQGLLAALACLPELYSELLDVLTPDLFASTQDTWHAFTLALETDQPPSIGMAPK